MTVTGSLAFQSGAQYLVQINPATSSFANVTGNATLAGTVAASFAAGSYVVKRYTILTAAGGVSGTFGSVTNIGIPSGFQTSLSYDATHAYLNLTSCTCQPPRRLNGNEQKVGKR